MSDTSVIEKGMTNAKVVSKVVDIIVSMTGKLREEVERGFYAQIASIAGYTPGEFMGKDHEKIVSELDIRQILSAQKAYIKTLMTLPVSKSA